MRRLFAAGLVALLIIAAFALTGCGGGGGGQAAAPAGGGEATAPAPAPVAAAPAVADDRSPTETVVYGPLPSDPSVVPSAVVDRVAAKQPMVIFFFDSTQRDTDEARAAVDAAIKPYRGLIDLVAFNVGKYVNSSTGEIITDAAIKTDDNASRAIKLADAMEVKFTPYVIVTDSYGYVVWRGRGPWDAKSIETQVIKATQ